MSDQPERIRLTVEFDVPPGAHPDDVMGMVADAIHRVGLIYRLLGGEAPLESRLDLLPGPDPRDAGNPAPNGPAPGPMPTIDPDYLD